MKRKSVIIAAAFLVCAGLLWAGPGSVTLTWDYPAIPNEVARTNLAFTVYTSTNPAGPWVVLTSVPGTNISATEISQTTITFDIIPGEHYFYVVARDLFWTVESDPSNTVGTPPSAVSVIPTGLRINKAP